MCAVSVVYDYYRQHTTPLQWSLGDLNELREIIRRLDLLDAKMGQPDCHDPAKAAWVRTVEERLAELEKKA